MCGMPCSRPNTSIFQLRDRCNVVISGMLVNYMHYVKLDIKERANKWNCLRGINDFDPIYCADPRQWVPFARRISRHEVQIIDSVTGEVLGRRILFERYLGLIRQLWIQFVGAGQQICYGPLDAPRSKLEKDILYNYVLIRKKKLLGEHHAKHCRLFEICSTRNGLVCSRHTRGKTVPINGCFFEIAQTFIGNMF
jgi:hypothetical protein